MHSLLGTAVFLGAAGSAARTKAEHNSAKTSTLIAGRQPEQEGFMALRHYAEISAHGLRTGCASQRID
jgi:hypothetical protein